MTELSVTKKNLYIDSCPIIVLSGKMFLDDESEEQDEHKAYANLVFKSISTKPIISVSFDLHIFDKANNKIELIRDYIYNTESLQRNEEFGSDINIELSSVNSLTLSITVKSVSFTEDDIWQGSNTILFETIPDRITIEEHLDEKLAIEQYIRDFKEKFAKIDDITPLYVPVQFEDLWLCACGEINRNNEQECFKCKAEFLPQKEYIFSPLQIEENRIAYEKMLEEKAIQEQLEAKRKAEEAEELRIMAKRQQDYDDMKAEIQAKERKTKIILRLFLYFPLILLAIFYGYLQINYIIPHNNYEKATELMENNNFDEAITIFEKLDDYSNSAEMINEVIFKHGEFEIENKNYNEAIELFNSISEKKDVSSELTLANYLLAISYYENEKYEDALKIFKELDDYEESFTYYTACNYNLAKTYANNDDLENALIYSSVLYDDYLKDIEEIYYNLGEKLYLAGDYENAYLYFDVIKTETVLNSVYELYYQRALVLITENKLDEAKEILLQIKDYKDSSLQLNKVYYLIAELLFTEKNYTEAIVNYELAEEYENSLEQINECNYQIALEKYNNKYYKESAEEFALLGDYKNSKEMATESTYYYGVKLANNGDYVESYNVLYPIRTNFKAYKFLVETSGFYRAVYGPGLGENPMYEPGLFKS